LPNDAQFEEFYQASYGRTVAMVAAITGSRHEAQAVAQEAYARALSRWSRLRGHDLPETWVRRVALRLVADSGRRLPRKLVPAVRLAAHRRPGDSEPADDPANTPLCKALLALPLHERQVIVLHYLTDLPVESVAAECGLPAGTVRTRLTVARRHLEQQLAGRPGSGDAIQDSDLRDQFEEWAGPLRETTAPGVAALRRRIRHRTASIAAAAGSAVAVVGLVAGLLVAGGLTGGKPGGPASQAQGSAYPAPSGQPYVFVNSSATFVNQGDAPTTPAELKNAATGKVVKVLQPVGPGTSFLGAAIAPSDRAFVLAQQNSDATVSFAEFRIGPSGEPGPLRLVMQDGHACTAVGVCVPSLSLPAGTQPASMTVNAPVTRLSFEAVPADGIGGSLVIYNLQTGALIGSWPIASNGYAVSQFLGDGDELVVSDSNVEQGDNRLVDASAAFRPGSSLLADSRPDRADGFPGSFSQDGNVSLNAGPGRVNSAGQAVGDVYLEVNSEPSGKLLRKIPMGLASALNGAYFCGVLWASADGGEVLTQCGTEQLQIVGRHVTRIRLAWLLPDGAGAGIATFAW
jgi:RNA polymerase sigma-70 factor, ECF subfamily